MRVLLLGSTGIVGAAVAQALRQRGHECHPLDPRSGPAAAGDAVDAAIGDVAVGTIVELTATDPTARIDVPVWCRLQRHRLREATEVEGAWRFRVERTR